jgi:hypothetical protein
MPYRMASRCDVELRQHARFCLTLQALHNSFMQCYAAATAVATCAQGQEVDTASTIETVQRNMHLTYSILTYGQHL